MGIETGLKRLFCRRGCRLFLKKRGFFKAAVKNLKDRA
jgi:hypothetical protein